jgi:hypothetical protein
MSNKQKPNLKNASKTARQLIKRITKLNKKSETVLSLIILAIGVALGFVFNEFILFLSISIALDIVFYLVVNDKK